MEFFLEEIKGLENLKSNVKLNFKYTIVFFMSTDIIFFPRQENLKCQTMPRWCHRMDSPNGRRKFPRALKVKYNLKHTKFRSFILCFPIF